ncbi:MAG: hypothetical protein KDB27_15320 [Planctomycetales bacterium]|nr:hypothetical protein [Planctomycetales bacterium]
MANTHFHADDDQARERPTVSDSPWFWIYLFATAGLIALMLAGNKFDHRQAEIEREFSARQSHGHVISGDEGPIAPPVAGEQHVTLRPLYIAMGVCVIVGWTVFYLRRTFGNV